MARDWRDLFITDDGEAGAPAAPGRRARAQARLLQAACAQNLSKTREALGAEIQATLLEGDVDEETWERLEEALIMADVGATTTARVVGELEAGGARRRDRGRRGAQRPADRAARRDRARPARTASTCARAPTVIMAVGVNGTGKTTTIGKLAWHLQRELGLKVVLGAARHVPRRRRRAARGLGASAPAARSSRGAEGADPGAVAFDAIAQGRERGADVVIIDTAGPPAQAGRPHGRAGEGPPRDRQADRRTRRTRRC